MLSLNPLSASGGPAGHRAGPGAPEGPFSGCGTGSSTDLSARRQALVTSVLEKLCREVLRKLDLATEADTKEGRDIICAEVFSDITGLLSEEAREQLSLCDELNAYYHLLAPYFAIKHARAEALLRTCRKLWAQSYIAPTYTLLLHRWLLTVHGAGGATERQKHLHVLFDGAQQLFQSDIMSGKARFAGLFKFLTTEVVLTCSTSAHLTNLPSQSQRECLSLVASYAPYYVAPDELLPTLQRFPAPETKEGEDSDVSALVFIVGEVTHTLRHLSAEAPLLRYLNALRSLQDVPTFADVDRLTRLRLQSELYSLTLPGGPRFPSHPVRRSARSALDTLFPLGRRMRWAVVLLFRLAYPRDWPGAIHYAMLCVMRRFMSAVAAAVRATLATPRALCTAIASVLHSVLLLSSWGRSAKQHVKAQ